MNESPEFSVPVECQRDPEAFELLSVWISNNQPTIQFRGNVWEDPAVWGIMLADILRMVARQYCQSYGQIPDAVVSRMLAGLRAEIQSWTKEKNGEIDL